jgi:hypothetical protein
VREETGQTNRRKQSEPIWTRTEKAFQKFRDSTRWPCGRLAAPFPSAFSAVHHQSSGASNNLLNAMSDFTQAGIRQ